MEKPVYNGLSPELGFTHKNKVSLQDFNMHSVFQEKLLWNMREDCPFYGHLPRVHPTFKSHVTKGKATHSL